MPFDFSEESNRIEYKAEVPDDFEETVVAFLNSSVGGEIYIGIDDKTKNVVRVGKIDLVQRQITDRIKNNIQPHSLGLFDIIVEKVEGAEIIRVVVSSGIEKPYYLRKKGMSPEGCFIRVGNSNQRMTKEQIEALYAKRIPLRLSNMRSPRQNLTFRQLEIYYSNQKLKLNDEFLTSLDLLDEDGRFNYAAYLLADENGVSIKVAKYAGTTKVDLIENEEYGYCCLITATNRVLDKLRVENRTFAKVTDQKRIERQMVDGLALKEALINAIVHNDYSKEVPPVVEIFSDRLTITSYGGLPQGLSQENFFRCRSMPRNRELMRIFKDVDLVEQLGSGMSRILDAYDSSIFTFEDDFLIVTFPFTNGFTLPTDNINDTSGNINDASGNINDASGNINDASGNINDTSGNINGPSKGNTNEFNTDNTKTTDLILFCIKQNPGFTLDKIAESTGISKRTVSRQLKELNDTGIIRRVGSRKTGHWEIISIN